jgi:hypothetical protein
MNINATLICFCIIWFTKECPLEGIFEYSLIEERGNYLESNMVGLAGILCG